MVKEDRMRFAGVASPEQHDIGLFNFFVRNGAASSPEYCRQTDDGGSVSSPVAGVNVVRPHHQSRPLLSEIVDFVGGLRARKHAESVAVAMLDSIACPAKTGSCSIKCFIPACWPQCTSVTNVRRRQTREPEAVLGVCCHLLLSPTKLHAPHVRSPRWVHSTVPARFCPAS